MLGSSFKGAYTAQITPFNKKDEIDEDGLRENVRYQIEHGIHGLVPVGTTGECATLSYEEHKHIIKIVVDEARGRVPVLAGAGSNSTWETIMLTKEAKEIGADGVLLVVPYYNKPTQVGLYTHFKKVAEEVDIPQVVYNIPSRTGVNMEPETVAKLAKLENIVGIKEASGNMDQVSKIISLTRGSAGEKDFDVLSGDDSLTLPILGLGGVGVISVASNIVPNKIARMVDCHLNGDIEGSKKLHYELLPLFKALFIETNPGPVKAAMELMKMPAGKPRLPLVEPKPENKERLKEILLEQGLINKLKSE